MPHSTPLEETSKAQDRSEIDMDVESNDAPNHGEATKNGHKSAGVSRMETVYRETKSSLLLGRRSIRPDMRLGVLPGLIHYFLLQRRSVVLLQATQLRPLSSVDRGEHHQRRQQAFRCEDLRHHFETVHLHGRAGTLRCRLHHRGDIHLGFCLRGRRSVCRCWELHVCALIPYLWRVVHAHELRAGRLPAIIAVARSNFLLIPAEQVQSIIKR